MPTSGDVESVPSQNSDYSEDEQDVAPIRCWDCNLNFTTKSFLLAHLLHHIKQPRVVLTKVQLPSLKITIKQNNANDFEVVPGGPESPDQDVPLINYVNRHPEEEHYNLAEAEEEGGGAAAEQAGTCTIEEYTEEEDEEANVNFSPNFAQVDIPTSPTSDSPNSAPKATEETEDGAEEGVEDAPVPGAEPTPPPEPEMPKIRIKTSGLLKEPLQITEITDDDAEMANADSLNNGQNSWNSSEDPLKLPGNDDIMSLFNNNERAKDLGFTTSESEFLPLDRMEDRNRNALQLYNSQSQINQNALSSLAGLPMEALAQQVSRLQPGMHQQNVLINIQQFPPAPPPPQPTYQPPPMYHHPGQPIYHQPYPYQPAGPVYYPPGHSYPPHMPPPQSQMPPPPPMTQNPMGQPPIVVSSQSQSQSMGQQPQYNPAMGPRGGPGPQPRQMPPRMAMGATRMPMGANRQPGMQQQQQRHPITPRQRAPPMMRPRGAQPHGQQMHGMRGNGGMRPRMGLQNGQVRHQQHQPMKRTPEQMQALQQAKKKRFDVLTPDKDDDDCQVICMQPKNTDGGLPQIQSVQGGTSEPSESSIMHLSDSITLSVRNPPPRPQSPKKSDAKAVANILATRGITVTATPKSKEAKQQDAAKNSAQAALNLNGAVSIIPSAKGPSKPTSPTLPTVDLTDDSVSSPAPSVPKPQTMQKPKQGLPFKCDLCPAQYPNGADLSKHRQNYHKTNSGLCEIGVPLINLKQPGIFQKLGSVGIFNYIPLPAPGPDGMYALPIINSRSPGNVAALGSTTMLTLGPVRNIPRPQMPNGVQGNKPAGVNPMQKRS